MSEYTDSAGGSCKSGRDKNTQAILASKGKILNTSEKSIAKLMKDKEVHDLVTSLGTGIGNEFNADKLDYHKIILLSDADVDGKHIDSLLVGFFWTHMRELIERGHLYLAKPPLFKLSKRDKTLGYAENNKELAKKLYSFISKNITEIEVSDLSGEFYQLDTKSHFKVFEYLMQYRDLLAVLETNTGIPKKLLEEAFLYYFDKDEMKESLAGIFQEVSPNFFKNNGDTFISFYDGDYIEINLDDALCERIIDFNNSVADMIDKLPFKIDGILSLNINYKKHSFSMLNTEIADFLHSESTRDIDVNYLKGLGELDPEQLWETTLDPAKRTLVQLTMNNFEECNDAIELTLYSKNADLRKVKIQEFIDSE